MVYCMKVKIECTEIPDFDGRYKSRVVGKNVSVSSQGKTQKEAIMNAVSKYMEILTNEQEDLL